MMPVNMVEHYENLHEGCVDERLVIPIGKLVQSFRPCEEDKGNSHNKKIKYIKNEHPDFLQELVRIDDQINDLKIIERIRYYRRLPSYQEVEVYDQLTIEKLNLMEQFARENFGSVEEFMEWWQG